ncbi:hypothetical protein HDE_11551 [Halotydeus destructor]|nr:hypothetical protein HDE_11551 [Halotydeus destructor]
MRLFGKKVPPSSASSPSSPAVASGGGFKARLADTVKGVFRRKSHKRKKRSKRVKLVPASGGGSVVRRPEYEGERQGLPSFARNSWARRPSVGTRPRLPTTTANHQQLRASSPISSSHCFDPRQVPGDGGAARRRAHAHPIPGSLAYLFGLFLEGASSGAEHYLVADEHLVVDLPPRTTELRVRFKFCPTTSPAATKGQRGAVGHLAYCQLRQDLLSGALLVTDLKPLSRLVAWAARADRCSGSSPSAGQLDPGALDLEAYVCGELCDWLADTGKREALVTLVKGQLDSACRADSGPEARFVAACPAGRGYLHSVFLDDEDQQHSGSFGALAVSDKGLTLYRLVFSVSRFWQLKATLVLPWPRILKVSSSSSAKAVFSVTLVAEHSYHRKALKYRFYCRGNRAKCQSLVLLCQAHHSRATDERHLSARYRDWLLASTPVKLVVGINGDEPEDKVTHIAYI